MVNPLLMGEQVRLTAIAERDLSAIVRLYEDSSFLRLYDAKPAAPRSEVQIREWMKETSHRCFRFAIRPVDGETILGVVELGDILWNHRTSWISIGLSAEYQGKGFGSETLRLAMGFAFNELNLFRVQLTVFSYNRNAITLYERLGFIREGTFRQFLNRDQKRHDMFLYGILKDEWLDHV
ncbi:GNAT family N-acetyltransferase [Kroppenstedtia pulmonis]|nr:GNAT family protein [Kroppenstedtia pulmonis]